MIWDAASLTRIDVQGQESHVLYSIFINAVPFLVAVTVLVFFHELGHFWVGRLCGVKVDAFSIGFGPELAHYVDRKGTRWRFAAIPLGGYVKFHGDANAASMPEPDNETVVPPSEKPVTLFGQNVWKRIAIVAAGPIANFIVAILIFTGLFYTSGEDVIRPEVKIVQAGSAAELAGLKPGDVITKIDGTPIDSFNDIKRLMLFSDGSDITVTAQRNGAEMNFVATPRRTSVPGLIGPMRAYLLGISPPLDHIQTKRYDLLQSLERGTSETWFRVAITGHFIKGLLVGRESTDQLSGPIGIAQVSGKVAQMGVAPFLEIVAIISVSIGLLNLLPIPMLDGGFLLFFLVEILRGGRALPERAQQVGFKIGLTFVAALSLFVAFNDITRLASQKSSAPAAAAVSTPNKK